MIGTRHEEYKGNSLPFVLFHKLKRTPFTLSKEQNWHEDIELQLCISGEGTVLLNGEKLNFTQDNIVLANSNVIHYTATETALTYTCLIISPSFFKQMGIDLGNISFTSRIKSQKLIDLILKLSDIYSSNTMYKTAKLNSTLLEIIIELCENYSEPLNVTTDSKALEKTKKAIDFIRLHYGENITLTHIAEGIDTDKYALCRDFKSITGQTVTEYLNRYRCQSAAEQIQNGATVSETAYNCGFSNLSYFTRTFKKHMGELPSVYQSRLKV